MRKELTAQEHDACYCGCTWPQGLKIYEEKTENRKEKVTNVQIYLEIPALSVY